MNKAHTVKKITTCPFCGETHDVATGFGKVDKIPKDGDLTLCNECGEWCLFDESSPGNLKKPGDRDYEFIRTSDFCRNLRKLWMESSNE